MAAKSVSSQDSQGPLGVVGPSSVGVGQMPYFDNANGKSLAAFANVGLIYNSGALGIANIAITAGVVAGTASIIDTTTAQSLSGKTISSSSIQQRTAALSDAATITPNADTTDMATVAALGQNVTLANPTGTPLDGQKLVVRITTSSIRTIAFGNQFRGGVTLALPSATTGSAKTDYLTFVWNAAASKWDIFQSLLGF